METKLHYKPKIPCNKTENYPIPSIHSDILDFGSEFSPITDINNFVFCKNMYYFSCIEIDTIGICKEIKIFQLNFSPVNNFFGMH